MTTTKTCSSCKLLLPATAFGRHASRADGLQSFCRECQRAAVTRYRNQSPAHRLAWNLGTRARRDMLQGTRLRQWAFLDVAQQVMDHAENVEGIDPARYGLAVHADHVIPYSTFLAEAGGAWDGPDDPLLWECNAPCNLQLIPADQNNYRRDMFDAAERRGEVDMSSIESVESWLTTGQG
jgi:hypothetical protein